MVPFSAPHYPHSVCLSALWPTVNKSIYKASTDAHVKQLKCQNYSLHVLRKRKKGRDRGRVVREEYTYMYMLDSGPTTLAHPDHIRSKTNSFNLIVFSNSISNELHHELSL